MKLETRYDSRASFYEKARTETTRNDYELSDKEIKELFAKGELVEEW